MFPNFVSPIVRHSGGNQYKQRTETGRWLVVVRSRSTGQDMELHNGVLSVNWTILVYYLQVS